MSFYQANDKMQAQLRALIDQYARDGRPGLHNSISVIWIRYQKPKPDVFSGIGASWSEKKLIYPASIVKLFYAVAIEAWLQKDLLPDSDAIREALKDMISYSSNDATSLIVDLLSGTTSGPSLSQLNWQKWKEQRNVINKWFRSLKWPELEDINCCQKTWSDGPYGREKEFYGEGRANQNQLTVEATGRMLEALMTNNIVSPLACKRIRSLMARSLDIDQRKSDPENQVDGFLGEGFIKGTKLWSKAGWMSTSRNDAAWCSHSQGNPMLLIVFCQGRQLANDTFLLPALANELQKIHLVDTEN